MSWNDPVLNTKTIDRHIVQMRQGGYAVIFRKFKVALGRLHWLPLYLLAIPAVVFIRLIRPWFLVRCEPLRSARLGHFTSNTEFYLCERDAGINVPEQRHVDLFFMDAICNQQLAKMWRRVLRIWPAWILLPIYKINRLIPGGAVHEISNYRYCDRDMHNFVDRFPPHLSFSAEEETFGQAGLRQMGLPVDSPFVCLNIRDSAYMSTRMSLVDWSYHDYRDSDIQNYVLAAEELAERGYFVIRMGAKVHESIKSSHPRVIDYATNGMRSDFMDIYLGAKCEFCISVESGFDGVPLIFRRPIACVNVVPLGFLYTYSAHFIAIPKHHFSMQKNRELTLREIFTEGGGFCLRSSDFDEQGIQLIENTPEEIRDVAVEVCERLKGIWQVHEGDDEMQACFREVFLTEGSSRYKARSLHGEIRSRIGTAFVRNNPSWLQ